MPKLVNLGSLCIDNVYRVPELAGAGETVASTSHAVFPGGKGLNQSIAAARGGATTVHVGCVGEDGAWLCEPLREAGVDVRSVRIVEGASGHAVIAVNEVGENAIVIAGGANRRLTDADVRAALDQCAEDDWLLLQNEINDLPGVLRAAAASGCQLAFNVAPADATVAGLDLSGVALLIVNEIEAAALADRAQPQAALDALVDRWPAAQVVLTLGRDGLLFAGPNGRGALAAYAADAVDETAAGDAFIGFLMAALLAGEELARALALGSAAGALAVAQPGAASSIPTLPEVIALVDA